MPKLTVKFYVTPIYPYGDDHYYHEIVALAEGFRDLGHRVIGNVNYWWVPETKNYLIPEENDSDFDIAIYDYRYVASFAHLLFRPGFPNFRKDRPHILIDRNDWISPIWTGRPYARFDLIAAGNLYTNVTYRKNMRPWAMGLTSRMMTMVDRFHDENETQELAIGHNFRVPNNVRELFGSVLSRLQLRYPLKECLSSGHSAPKPDWPEVDRAYWKQTTRRHDPDYFRALNRHLLFSTICGYREYRPLLYQPYSCLDKIRRRPFIWWSKIAKAIGLDESAAYFMFQHDSFRFYEALYSRACPVQIDLEDWNFWIPEMPKSDLHYLGIRRFDAQGFAHKLSALNPASIVEIGQRGRAFAREHYAPVPQAGRLLKYLKEVTGQAHG